jgi:cell division septum initiation protein DivIVA
MKGTEMPKKKGARPVAKNNERVPRKEPYSPDRVGGIVKRLRDQAARLAGLAQAMEDAQLGDVTVDGHAMLLRGLNQVDNFADNAARAVREEKNRRSA